MLEEAVWICLSENGDSPANVSVMSSLKIDPNKPFYIMMYQADGLANLLVQESLPQILCSVKDCQNKVRGAKHDYDDARNQFMKSQSEK
jgi:hypothetical protein